MYHRRDGSELMEMDETRMIQRSGSAIIICIGLVIRRDDQKAGGCQSFKDELRHASQAKADYPEPRSSCVTNGRHLA
jgi:hypothetical protein